MREGTSARRRRWLWRWRSNPLRRHDDIVEAWLVLAVWTVVVLGGAVAGLVTAHAADEVFARQRAERHSVRAVLLADTPALTLAAWGKDDQAWGKVRWNAPDGTTRTGRTLVGTDLAAGTSVTIWQDRQGRLTDRPIDRTEASVEAGFLGAGAALALTGVVVGAGAVVRWRLDRRRIDQWGREWALVGPQWGHKTG
ncbi:Rv1733c family protein [Streptomyces sp. HUAS TT20]|uniref:Rv1733c family protein n=1 Tax=Streptomyces sp. HUAS TT20 TaxID=3447509 RepID=UPI0021D95C75|nr:hypothetical protein [Streptomyces sp. HUAS 15-9]UXY25678.1 hypothetical protein N8I87_03245 [Streptomyces sp. HUAS 15-9]